MTKNDLLTILTETMPEIIKIDDVYKAYSGKPGACMCGCSGTYYYPKLKQKEGSKHRGYKVKNNDVDDKEIKNIFNKFYKNDGIKIKVIIAGNNEYIFTKVIEKRQ